jgi:hypothetical protein
VAKDSVPRPDGIGQRPAFRPAIPELKPAPDEPGTLAEQMLAVMDWLSQLDAERLEPASWERSRRRWISHARRAGRERLS